MVFDGGKITREGIEAAVKNETYVSNYQFWGITWRY